MRPLLAKGDTQRIQRIWKNAILAKENGMEFHFRTLPPDAEPCVSVGALESTVGG
jgi:hypothetical protein